jgi:hypothetical protein
MPDMMRRRFTWTCLPAVPAFFLAVGLPTLARSQGTNITVPAAQTTPITYTFISYAPLQNGYTLSGTVTTDGTIGALTDANITAWTWTITNGVNSDTESGTSLLGSNSVGLSASATELLVNGDLGEVVFQGPPNTYLEYAPHLQNYDAAILGGIRAWSSTTTNTSLGGNPWVIAQTSSVCVAPPSGMVGWWPADGNSKDIIGGNNGTPVGGVTFAPGEVGQAFSLDGSSGYVNVVDSSGTLSISGPLTLDAWVQLNTLGKTQHIMIKDSGTCSGAFHNYQLLVTNTNKVDFAVGDGTNVYELQSSSQLSTGTWYHIAAVYDGNNQAIYINGVQDASVTIGSKTLYTNPSYPLHIGAAIESCAFYPLAGLIDELEIFNRALGASEIQAIFDAGTAGKCKPTPQTVSWKGLDWGNTYPQNTIGLNADGTLSVFTGDTAFGIFGGASHQTPPTLQAANEAWAETSFFDTGSAPGDQIFIILFEAPGSAFYASLGAFGNQGRYYAHWRRDSPNPAEAVLGTTIDVGPRSFGPHTARIGRRSDGRLEFWLDGKLVQVSGSNAFPATFNFVSLIASAGTAVGQIATFTDYREGTGPGPVAAPNVTPFADRLSWQGSSGALTTIGFENLAAPGSFVAYDNPAGLTLSGVNFTGLTPITGPTGPTRDYLRVVDPAYFPPFYDWGSGAVLHGPPIPVGPQGEGGPNSRIRVTLPSGVTSVGVDLMSFLQYASPFTVVVSTTNGSVAFPVTSSLQPTRSFFGVTSDSPIISLDYYALNGFPVLDNFAFGGSVIVPTCTFSLSPRGQSFGAQGGLGSFFVNTAPTCTFGATSSASWITLLPGSSCTRVGDVVICGIRKVNFAVASNTGAARSASIDVADQHFNVDQQGLTCALSVNPGHVAFDGTGGDSRVVVNGAGGCAWFANSNAAWISVTSGADGAGNGVIVLHAATNPDGARTGTVTIFNLRDHSQDQTVSVRQSPGGPVTCGRAVDVSSKVQVRLGGFVWVPWSTYTYTETFTVTNTSGAVIHGPLVLVLIGLVHNLPYPNGVFVNGPLTHCFSSQGDVWEIVWPGDLPPGQTQGTTVGIFTQSPAGNIQYQWKVLSGIPGP